MSFICHTPTLPYPTLSYPILIVSCSSRLSVTEKKKFLLKLLTDPSWHPAGRDRTGVLAGLLESLAGLDAGTIQTDFLLSRIGYEPAREQLIRFALTGAGVDASQIPEDLSQLFDVVPGFWNLASLKPTYWDAFVKAVNKRFGGFEGYVVDVLGFSRDDLVTIRKNLTQVPE